MKRTVLVFGLISGLIVSVWMVASMAWFHYVENCQGSMVLGYAGMLLAFSFVFVGVKSYRDKHNGGVISFGKAFQMGLYISLIASTLYVISWLVDYYVFIPDFMDKYGAQMLKQAQSSGASAAELSKKAAEVASMKAMYKSPIMVVLYTYMEPFPVGLIVSLVTALVLKRKATGGAAVMA
ncbi:MAG: DUF4199 domain-containing protein [Mucilaginibacter sp.]|uniref:DUF4199 domain-containing protein n=1 Tax=Mucilaginibacter sp. TaxID=1882438 RepID=UPI003266CCA2